MNTKDTILIVDDEEVNRKILVHIFEKKYRILQAANGEEALRVIDKEKGYIRAILLDVVMPKMDGFAVMERLKNKGYLRFIPVILVTANSSADAEVKGFQMGVVDFVSKPIDPIIVQCRVRNAINLFMQKNKLEILANRQKKTISSQEQMINKSQEQIINVLTNLVESREVETREHIQNIRNYTQIVSIADVYDGLVGERVYKERFSPEESYDMIMNGECGLFNPLLLRCFSKVKDKFQEVSH